MVATGLTIGEQSNGYIKRKYVLAVGSPLSYQSPLSFLPGLIKEQPFRRVGEHVSLASERALDVPGELGTSDPRAGLLRVSNKKLL